MSADAREVGVAVAMVGDLVAVTRQRFNLVKVAYYTLADDEERPVNTITVKHLHYGQGVLIIGAIIESKCAKLWLIIT